VSIRIEAFDRARHRQELRKYTDLKLILAGHRPDNCSRTMAEWRARQQSRRAGVGVCLCHAPVSQAITSRARMCVGISSVARAAIMSRALLAEKVLPRRHRAQAAHTQCLYYRIHNDPSWTPSCRRWARAAQEASLAS
jgi:hypothetical protein